MTLLFIFVLIAIGISFLCSILEAVILSCTPSFLHSIRQKKPRVYGNLKKLHVQIEKPLAAILSLNTFAHTIGAAGAGAQAQRLFGDKWLTLFSVMLTLAILFFSEIIPKSFGARYWKSLIPFAARILPLLVLITYPLVFISEKISLLIKGKKENRFTRDEIRASADIGFQEGTLSATEHRIFKSLMHFPAIEVSEILTKARNVKGLVSGMTTQEAFEQMKSVSFSRLPVYDPNQEVVRGYVLRDEVLMVQALDQNRPLDAIMKPIITVPGNFKIKTLFLRLLNRHEHIACVVNPDGGFQGIVTLEDVLETLLNHEIFDEMDQA